MTPKEKKEFLHVLEKKLTNFKKRIPIYCQCIVLFDEDLVCITLPDLNETTIKVPVDFSVDVSDCVRHIHDMLKKYFPVFCRKDKEFYVDKVDFKSNSFVVKSDSLPEDWSAIYQMKPPVSLLLRKLQSASLTPFEKEKLFSSSILRRKSEEDYLVL